MKYFICESCGSIKILTPPVPENRRVCCSIRMLQIRKKVYFAIKNLISLIDRSKVIIPKSIFEDALKRTEKLMAKIGNLPDDEFEIEKKKALHSYKKELEEARNV